MFEWMCVEKVVWVEKLDISPNLGAPGMSRVWLLGSGFLCGFRVDITV